MKVRITKKPCMEYGGQQKGGFALDLNQSAGSFSTDHEDSLEVNTHLKEVDRSVANIEAEAGETALGDFDQDGMLEHFKIGGKPHSQGGTPLAVPDGTFIFSDSKKLKIKDPFVLDMFGRKGKKGFTPAQLAKKYDLNKYKSTLDDEHADPFEKTTATLMIENNQKKLGQLAIVQEAMKGFPQGLPTGVLPQMAVGGQIPKAYTGWYNRSFFEKIPGFNQQPEAEENPTAPKAKKVPFGFSTPDMLSMLSAASNLSMLRKHTPYIAPMRATVPQATYYDPTREIAANAEQANSQMMYTAMSADGARGRAINSAIQGQSLSNIANVMGRYSNMNVQQANLNAAQRAEIENKQAAYDADRATELHKGNVIATQQYDNARRAGENQLLKSYINAWNNRSKLDLVNSTNEFFYIDPQSGRLVQRAGKSLQTGPQTGGNSGGYEAVLQRIQELKRQYPHVSDSTLEKIAMNQVGMGEITTRNRAAGIQTRAAGYLNNDQFYTNSLNPYE